MSWANGFTLAAGLTFMIALLAIAVHERHRAKEREKGEGK